MLQLKLSLYESLAAQKLIIIKLLRYAGLLLWKLSASKTVMIKDQISCANSNRMNNNLGTQVAGKPADTAIM